jgi:hypothetical protein
MGSFHYLIPNIQEVHAYLWRVQASNTNIRPYSALLSVPLPLHLERCLFPQHRNVPLVCG